MTLPIQWAALTDADRLEEARKLLAEWERFARTLWEADTIAMPRDLMNRTVGLLDATAV